MCVRACVRVHVIRLLFFLYLLHFMCLLIDLCRLLARSVRLFVPNPCCLSVSMPVIFICVFVFMHVYNYVCAPAYLSTCLGRFLLLPLIFLMLCYSLA